MKFLERQIYTVENLLSYKAKVDSRELNDMLLYAVRNLDALSLTLTGSIILNLSGMISEEGKRIYEIEALFPVERPFESKGSCVYKPVFRLENAVCSRFYGGLNNIPEIKEHIYRLLDECDLKPVTHIYFMLQRYWDKHCCNNILDAYVGINNVI